MISEFEDSVRNVINERLEVIRLDIFSNNKRYRRLSMRIKKVEDEIDRITESLPDEVKELFMHYEDLEADLNSILQKDIYRKGLRDGIRLANIARKVLNL